jgi:hypothetical protein
MRLVIIYMENIIKLNTNIALIHGSLEIYLYLKLILTDV